MSMLEEKAAEVAGYMRDAEDNPVPEAVAFDPITILTILSILLTCIEIWQKCNATPEVATENLKDSVLARGQIRRVIRAKAREDVARADRKEFRTNMMDAIYKMGSKITVADMEKLFAEAEAKSKELKA